MAADGGHGREGFSHQALRDIAGGAYQEGPHRVQTVLFIVFEEVAIMPGQQTYQG